MLARLLDRLTYANVVATLALFVALGGSAYAVGEISSRDVKNRSLKGGDLRLNTVTGKEINESKLGTVPAARQADSAGLADISRQSNSATTAGTADVANLARDAQSLAGQGVGVFERSSRTQFGKAGATPAGPPDEQVLLSWPELGVQITTSSQVCGGDAQFAVKSTKTSGNLEAFEEGASFGAVAPGAIVRRCASGGQDEVDAEVTDASGRTLFVDCVESEADNQLRCIGTRSEP